MDSRGGWEQERVAINCEPSKIRMGVRGRGPGKYFGPRPSVSRRNALFLGKGFSSAFVVCELNQV